MKTDPSGRSWQLTPGSSSCNERIIEEHRKQVDRLFEKLPSHYEKDYKQKFYLQQVAISDFDVVTLSSVGISELDKQMEIMNIIRPREEVSVKADSEVLSEHEDEPDVNNPE